MIIIYIVCTECYMKKNGNNLIYILLVKTEANVYLTYVPKSFVLELLLLKNSASFLHDSVAVLKFIGTNCGEKVMFCTSLYLQNLKTWLQKLHLIKV